jgi:hypothetical protein
VIVIASWAYVGSGYETEGERWLALEADLLRRFLLPAFEDAPLGRIDPMTVRSWLAGLHDLGKVTPTRPAPVSMWSSRLPRSPASSSSGRPRRPPGSAWSFSQGGGDRAG